MSELKEILLGFGVWSIIIILIFITNKHNEKIEKQQKEESTEEKKTREEREEKIGTFFIVSFGLVFGVFLCYQIYKNTDWCSFWDFERKGYIPYLLDDKLLLINKYNGKTYMLEHNETNNTYFYEFKFIARPKSKQIKVYSKKDPLNLDF